MPNYKLTFKVGIDAEWAGDSLKTGRTFIRVISADTAAKARALGKSMVGEEVYPCEWLDSLKSVKKTDEEVPVSPLDELCLKARHTIIKLRRVEASP
jgi:hypothetical protein